MPELLGLPGWAWSAPPPASTLTADGLDWTCGPRTDFWRVTQGVATKHDGQALLLEQAGDFRFEASFTAPLAAQYDQVGVLVEADEEHWLKCGIELDDRPWLSAVHTRIASDWSREPHAGLPIRLRVERADGTVTASLLEGDDARIFRVVHLPGVVRIGPYSCAPQGPGFPASLRDVALT